MLYYVHIFKSNSHTFFYCFCMSDCLPPKYDLVLQYSLYYTLYIFIPMFNTPWKCGEVTKDNFDRVKKFICIFSSRRAFSSLQHKKTFQFHRDRERILFHLRIIELLLHSRLKPGKKNWNFIGACRMKKKFP